MNLRATLPRPPLAACSRSTTRAPSRRRTPSRMTPRLWPWAPLAATASSTPMSCRPNAPASTHRPSREMLNPAHRLRNPLPPRIQPRQPQRRTMQTSPKSTTEAFAVRAGLCARLDQVSKLFGSFAALRQVSVELEPGRCYVLLGENGAGKSTLLRILAGLLRPSFGKVRVFCGPEKDGLEPG